MEFFREIFNPSMPFLRYALLTGILGSVAFGMMGTLVVIRRITSLAGAIAHAVLGGVGAALYFQRVCGVTWMTPMLGALISAVAAALVIGAVSMGAKREREDTVIGVIWALGMATGLLFLAKTPGYVDLQGYLFGNILLVSRREVWTTLLLDVVIVAPVAIFFNGIVATIFDDCFAMLRGARVKLIYFLILLLTALTIVVMVNVVGIILVIALLTLPAATAGIFTRNVWSMMALSVVLGMFFVTGGLMASYGADLPSGPVIVVIAVLIYLPALLWSKYGGKLFLKKSKLAGK